MPLAGIKVIVCRFISGRLSDEITLNTVDIVTIQEYTLTFISFSIYFTDVKDKDVLKERMRIASLGYA